MKKIWKKGQQRIIALLLVICLAGSSFAISDTYAMPEQEENTDVMAASVLQADETAKDTDTLEKESEAGGQISEEVNEESGTENKQESEKNEQVNKSELKLDSEETVIEQEQVGQEEATAVSAEQEQEDEEKPFNLSVTYDGKELSIEEKNDITDDWSGGKSKTLQVVTKRNSNVAVDDSKKYVLCMKVSELFYFNGIPEKNKITGAKDITLVQNTVPVVGNKAGNTENLQTFSPYSGEIRIELNTIVDMITIPDVAISYNKELIGYANGAQTIADPLQVKIIEVDKNVSLDTISDADKPTTLKDCKIDSVQITTESLSSSGMKNTISTKAFLQDGVNEQDVTLGKNDTVSYAGGTAGQNNQVYGELEIVFDCPYITVEKQKYYLKIADANDSAFTANKQGNKKGYTMSENAVYDENTHTITYKFKNIYLGGHTPLFYTPVFSWPEELSAQEVEKNCSSRRMQLDC